MQLEYSLVARDVEAEHFPAAREAGMGIMPWSPLAGGFLTGKYTREKASDSGRLSGENPFGDTKFTDRNWEILEALRSVATELDRPPAQVALAWTLSNPAVSSTLVGASTLAQRNSNIEAIDLPLSSEQMARLNEASAPPTGFTATLAMPMVRRMVLGGHDVTAWGVQTA